MYWKIAFLLATVLVSNVAGFFRFGPGARDSNLGRTDDGSRTKTLSVAFRFYGRSYRSVRIYNNGYVSMGTGITGGFTPRPFPRSGAIIAPYWADADATVGLGRTYYRETSSSSQLAMAKSFINSAYCTNFNPRRVLIVTWYRLGYYRDHQDKLNTFQLVMATNGIQSYAIFLYSRITWTTGDASGGRNGFGGTRARAGLNAGFSRRQITIPGSGSTRILSIRLQSNVGTRGRFIYRTDTSIVASRPPSRSSLYSFGTRVGDRVISPNDDSFRTLRLRRSIKFYGRRYSSVIVYNNGYLSVGGRTGGFTPRPFPRTGKIIAPYWADVDTRSGSGRVFYRETTSFSQRLRAARQVRRIYHTSFLPTHLIIATWNGVGYYNRHTDKLNTFQCVIASNSIETYIIFIYNCLQWTTGDASGGRNGFRGTIARAGINAGDRRNSITLFGSGTSSVLRFTSNTNVGYRGIYVLTSGFSERYPFGGRFRDRNLGRNDDGSATASFTMPFYRRTERVIRVYNNGYLSLRGSAGGFTPRPFPLRGNPIIAPYWADADTRAGIGRTHYRSTVSSALRWRAKFEVEATYRRTFTPRRLFIATWDRVGYYSRHTNRLNSFQVVLATDSRSTYVLNIYKSITWTTGDASGGRGGFGGTRARAGINSGTGRSTTIPGSGSSLMLSLERRTNVRIPGCYILRGNPARLAILAEESAVVESNDADLQNYPSKEELEAQTTVDDDHTVSILSDELEALSQAEDSEEVEDDNDENGEQQGEGGQMEDQEVEKQDEVVEEGEDGKMEEVEKQNDDDEVVEEGGNGKMEEVEKQDDDDEVVEEGGDSKMEEVEKQDADDEVAEEGGDSKMEAVQKQDDDDEVVEEGGDVKVEEVMEEGGNGKMEEVVDEGGDGGEEVVDEGGDNMMEEVVDEGGDGMMEEIVDEGGDGMMEEVVDEEGDDAEDAYLAMDEE